MYRKAQVSLVKIFKILLITIFIVALVVPTLGCSTESDEAELPETQIVTVQRGDLTIDITAAGNLALSHTEDLAFDLFYQEGTVEEVLVEEGDIVTAGQVLARLDTEEWEDQLGTLEDRVTTEERDLLQAQINLQTAADNLKNAQEDMEATDALELAIYNAEISVRNKEKTVDETRDIYTWPDIEIAQLELERAESYLEYVIQDELSAALKAYAESRVIAAQAALDAKINSYDTEEVAIAKMQLEAAQMSLAKVQKDLDDYLKEATEDLAIKEQQLTLSQGKLEDAEKALADARDELDDASGKSPVIVALFDGFITRVNVAGGDEVMTGTVAVQLADPNKFEADILVNEMDIMQIKLGGEARVQVDAMSGLTLPAKVTHISPTATIQSGVVNYEIKVELAPLEAAAQERHEARQETMQNITSGELPDRLKQAIAAGQITQEQAEEKIKQMQPAQGGQQGQVPTVMPEDFQLREGLTVTVSILVDEASDVLIVPNSAITRQGVQSYVKVVSADGTIEERAIQTGISDWQYTEVTGGLSEGEQIIVPQGTAAIAATTQQGSKKGPMPFLPPHK